MCVLVGVLLGGLGFSVEAREASWVTIEVAWTERTKEGLLGPNREKTGNWSLDGAMETGSETCDSEQSRWSHGLI